MKFVLTNFETNLIVLGNGVKNGPATTLYLSLGFKDVKQWDTNLGVRK